jgi:hypothetical protein
MLTKRFPSILLPLSRQKALETINAMECTAPRPGLATGF